MSHTQSKNQHYARLRFVAMLVVGITAGGVLTLCGLGQYAALGGWCAACGVYLLWVWVVIGAIPPERTAAHATREDPSRTMSDFLLVCASLASLVVVGVVLSQASSRSDSEGIVLTVLSVASVIFSWLLVHTLFTLRYAVLYFSIPRNAIPSPGAIDFNQEEPPRYTDFAYLAFTIGMTFQVSDTSLRSPRIRATALKHALLSYLFGAVILATMVNLIAGLVS
ncbi:DUF1345 domain-containing protein [Lysinibacter sp. HNR]|uniref:DUF1345 domain-containing protein n=1 Tax=Lysinibacter sp. HNR TaxID=3031408 RepID=UPI002435A928|nr:DUF1345 domain-containing protein [Lysinibacter sp. HNR]WGD36788.1 DUF1345 domain-containing protein [Lysinibacter sp. HNR]